MIHKQVIDTNVAIVANGKETHASNRCRLSCIELLEICNELDIVLDNHGLIMSEYRKHLSYAGRPGIGDMFFKYLYDHQNNSTKIGSFSFGVVV